MAYMRDTLSGLTAKQRASWYRKAEGIHRKLQYLMAEAIDAVGVEHRLTDEIDDVLCTAEGLVEALRPEKRRS